MIFTDNGVGTLVTGNEILFESSVFVNNSATAGGALASDQSNTVAVQDCRVDSNTASVSYGGAVWLQHSCTLASVNSTFSNNAASTCGGAITTSDHSTVHLTGTVLSGNSAAESGGALCLQSD